MEEKLFQIVKAAYTSSEKRILFLDYDGTLVPFSNNPEDARPQDDTRNLINDLSAVKENTVVIISGRDCHFLENIFSGMNVTLVAEHGLFVRKPEYPWVSVSDIHNEWKNGVRAILENYRQHFSRSMIEEKKGSLAWHYRNSTLRPDNQLLKNLVADLEETITKNNLEVLLGNCVAEVKDRSVDKGSAALSLINESSYGFILAAGDDVTDESLFKALPGDAFSIKIGNGETAANYCCLTAGKITDLLHFLLL